MKKQILIAVDGSTYSSQSLEYIALLFGDRPEIDLHLTTCISSSESAFPVAADSSNSLTPEFPGVQKKRLAAQDLLQKAADKLVRLEISPERIKTSVTNSGQDIGATIQQQAEHLLVDSILIGRRGLNTLSEMLLGSVSSTLLQRCHRIPLWILDGAVANKNFLAPVDGSLPSLLAIDHLAHIMEGRQDITLFLFHCNRFFGKKIEANPAAFYHIWDKEWCDTHLVDDDHLFRGPTQLLIEAGIPEDNIIILPETVDLEPAHSILRQADKNHCGTIVIGRRGDGTASGLLGGVSDRTVKRGQDVALWLVG